MNKKKNKLLFAFDLHFKFHICHENNIDRLRVRFF